VFVVAISMTKFVVGLIGGIGSGKSRVADAFVRRGARVVSGDEAGHEALRQPEVIAWAEQRWGRSVLDGQGNIVRSKVAAIVFQDPEERKALERVVFPWIGARLKQQLDEGARDPAVQLLVLDAAVLLEAGWNRWCDRIVYVHAPREMRLQRLAEQRGWTEKEVAARERAQLSLAEKASRADDAVDNSGSPEQTDQQVDALWRRWGLP
jgi:dephospho-CoA kinase